MTTLHLRPTLPSTTPIVVDLPAVVSDDWVRNLLARIASEPVAPAVPVAGRLGDDVVHMDLDRRIVALHGRQVTLRHQEFVLLRVFLEHPDRALTRRQLLELAWGEVGSGPRTVDVHVRRLRVKLGSEAHRLATVRGYGYRFDTRETLAAAG